MSATEIKKHKKLEHSWITWSFTIIVIVLTLQTFSAEARKEKTLDVIPVGGSDEFYERDYRPPPRYRSPPPPPYRSPPPPRPSPPPLVHLGPALPPPPRKDGKHTDYSEEYYHAKHARRGMGQKKRDDLLSQEKEDKVVEDLKPKTTQKPKAPPPPPKPKTDAVHDFAPGGDEAYRPVQRRRLYDDNKQTFIDVTKQTPNANPKEVTPVKTAHKVKDATTLVEGRNADLGMGGDSVERK